MDMGIQMDMGMQMDLDLDMDTYHGKMVPNVTKFGDMKGFSSYPILVS